MEKIAPYLKELKSNFNKGISKDLAFRKSQLHAVIRGITELSNDLKAGCMKDLGRCEFFTEIGELMGIIDHCKHNLEHLDEYAKDVWFDTPLLLAPNSARIKYEPLGVVLIFGSWNYPYYVTLKPLVQAIATGNCAIIKPSEMSPASSAVV